MTTARKKTEDREDDGRYPAAVALRRKRGGALCWQTLFKASLTMWL